MDRISLFVRENIRLLLGAAVVIFVIVLLLTLVLARKTTKVTMGNHTFSVSVARTEKEKQIGLSERKSLAKNDGMLFLFDQPDYYAFWMKNMDFPIDIVYVDNNKVVYIVKDAKPVSSGNLPIFQPNQKANEVLEINAGLSNQYNIKQGTSVKTENL